MRTAMQVLGVFAARQRSFFVGLMGLALAVAIVTPGRAQELPASVAVDITSLAAPLTIPAKRGTLSPVDFQEIITFRLFVSSTFSDLKEERNALQKKVFPKLRALYGQHSCQFQAIDLRWRLRGEARPQSRDDPPDLLKGARANE